MPTQPGTLQQSTAVLDGEGDDKNPERMFLLLRESRRNETKPGSDERQKQADEIYEFWNILKTKLSEWASRLDLLTQRNAVSGDNAQANTSVRQEFEDLKEELRLLRRRCLNHGGSLALLPAAEENWKIPDFFPMADLRMLHAEFTKRFQQWEGTKQAILPKEKFVFTKYRQELARRNALGLPSTSPSERPAWVGTRSSTVVPSMHTKPGTYIQDISHATILVDHSGCVLFDENDTGRLPMYVNAETLLLRNLNDCTIRIDKPLQALHLVGLCRSRVIATLPISSAVHATICEGCFIQASQVQQLRLHESKNLQCHIESITAGAILEDCGNIVFFVPSSPLSLSTETKKTLDIKDFNWLREGIPSPNFRIEDMRPVASPMLSAKMKQPTDYKPDCTNISITKIGKDPGGLFSTVGDADEPVQPESEPLKQSPRVYYDVTDQQIGACSCENEANGDGDDDDEL